MTGFAQDDSQIESGTIHLDTVAVTTNHYTVEKLIFKIVKNEDFKYRQAIKKARRSKRFFTSTDQTISEVEVLKHFKRAARHSDSVDEFISYFYDRNLSFISSINKSVISTLYTKIRSTTFNGYLDELETVVGTGH